MSYECVTEPLSTTKLDFCSGVAEVEVECLKKVTALWLIS